MSFTKVEWQVEEELWEYRLLDVPSAWRGIERIMKPLIKEFNIKNNLALEFGVEYGYSTAILSALFDKVIGVDTFTGDAHSSFKDNHKKQTETNLKECTNIELFESTWEQWSMSIPPNSRYDLIHVDIVHDYDSTFNAGEWAVQHSDVVIFHDTALFGDVDRAVSSLSEKYEYYYYNYPLYNGLGILSKYQRNIV